MTTAIGRRRASERVSSSQRCTSITVDSFMYTSRIFILLFVAGIVSSNSSDDFEDITAQHTYDSRDTVPPLTSSSRSLSHEGRISPRPKNHDVVYQYARKDENSIEITDPYSQPVLRDEFGRAPLAAVKRDPIPRKTTSKVNRGLGQHHQVIAGIPDTNDPCFRRYANCIVVNAQPYERRSSISLIHCKSHCLHSQTGVYTCRSFVYDNINQVCDLFAHVGDQSPARLLKFQSRDYFEPTHAVECIMFLDFTTSSPSTTTTPSSTTASTTTTTSTSTFPSTSTSSFTYPPTITSTTSSSTTIDDTATITISLPHGSAVVRAIKVEQHEDSDDFVGLSAFADHTEPPQPPTDPPTASSSDGVMRCPAGKKISFLRTEGFQLFNNDDMTLLVFDVDECVAACEKNEISGRPLDCRSFDYVAPTCFFSSETAVPAGSGQLQQRNDSFYYEKICVSDTRLSSCAAEFSRFPQMVLVGFAEAVTDAVSFEACFDSCMDSSRDLGFNCTSGMYFFEEPQLNCILNSENRFTQRDLFAEENTDIVDYFEIGCEKTFSAESKHRAKAATTFRGTKRISSKAARIFPVPEKLVIASETRTEWSVCEDGLQHRRRDCGDRESCGLESRPCKAKEIKSTPIQRDEISAEELPSHDEVVRVKAKVRKFGLRCAPDVCCTVFDSCAVGLRLNTKMKRLEWCKRPCHRKPLKQP
ncbi:hypothetical protein Q1695_014032 [Nippostrongylus brasiliensis]|nr:hypothetical protein Q1695_014032 [Nippostrongylus brasiliensis]